MIGQAFILAVGLIHVANALFPCVDFSEDSRGDVYKQPLPMYFCKVSSKPQDETFCYVKFVHKNATDEILFRGSYNPQTNEVLHTKYEMVQRKDGRTIYPESNTTGETFATSESRQCILFWKCPPGKDAFVINVCTQPELCKSSENDKLVADGLELLSKKGVTDLKLEDTDQEVCKNLGVVPPTS